MTRPARPGRPGRARGESEVEKCLSLGAPPASPIDVCVGPRDREAGRRDDGGDDGVDDGGGDGGDGGDDCDDGNDGSNSGA